MVCTIGKGNWRLLRTMYCTQRKNKRGGDVSSTLIKTRVLKQSKRKKFLAKARKSTKKKANQKSDSKELASDEDEDEENTSADIEKLKKQKEKFGVVVLESDLDLDKEVVYQIYQDRWKIEFLFKRYKNDIELKTTNV